MKRSSVRALAAAALAALIVVIPAAAAELPLRVVSQDATTWTIGWDAQEGAYGFRFFRDATPLSHTFDGSRTTVRFAKGGTTYGVTELVAEDIGTINPNTPPPPPTGTTLTFTNTWWRCSQPVASLATNGLPLTVHMTFTPGTVVVPPTGAGVIQLGAGCVGDGTSATDLILIVDGDGRTYGSGDDAIRLMNATPGASNLQIEGHADCGPRAGAAHQDGIQILGGTNVTFRNFTVGNYEAGDATCQGAGGTVFYSLPSTNVDVEGGEFIGCNHSLYGLDPANESDVRNAKFRSGRINQGLPCSQFFASAPCIISNNTRTENLVCQRWSGTAWVNDTIR